MCSNESLNSGVGHRFLCKNPRLWPKTGYNSTGTCKPGSTKNMLCTPLQTGPTLRHVHKHFDRKLHPTYARLCIIFRTFLLLKRFSSSENQMWAQNTRCGVVFCHSIKCESKARSRKHIKSIVIFNEAIHNNRKQYLRIQL